MTGGRLLPRACWESSTSTEGLARVKWHSVGNKCGAHYIQSDRCNADFRPTTLQQVVSIATEPHSGSIQPGSWSPRWNIYRPHPMLQSPKPASLFRCLVRKPMRHCRSSRSAAPCPSGALFGDKSCGRSSPCQRRPSTKWSAVASSLGAST